MEIVATINDELRNFQDYLDVTICQNNGVIISEFKMTLTDYIQSLSAAGAETETIETPILPPHCIKLVSKPAVQAYWVLMEIPKQQWVIEYSNQLLKVGFPRLIFMWGVTGKRVALEKIVAVKQGGRINGDTLLFHFPYSHVNAEGEVCMGGNAFPEIDCLSKLETMHSLFFNSPFSSDYGATTTTGKKVWELFTDVCFEKEFHDEYLVPFQQTFNEFFHVGYLEN